MNEKKGVLDTVIEKGFKIGLAGCAVVAAYVGVKYVVDVVHDVKNTIEARKAAKDVEEVNTDEED